MNISKNKLNTFMKQNRGDDCFVLQEGRSIFCCTIGKHLCPLQDFFFCNFKFIAVLRRACEKLFKFRAKRSHRYGEARSCKKLKIIILDSLAVSFSMFLNPNKKPNHLNLFHCWSTHLIDFVTQSIVSFNLI